ncbi:MAG: response regulator [Selenomonadaceae bacterium]|nr:response regulator [Selenomonadaceae bacterium]
MDGEEKNGILRLAIIGSVIVAVILVIGTLWTGRNASEDTEQAVRTVSLLYLEELAGRREQVVASTLGKYISDMDIAIELLNKDDLSSVENLQNYQARMKQLYELEKFAFVDEDGLIYTSRGTRTDIATYSFDFKNLTEPEISIKNLEGNNKKLVIAAPVDRLPFQGKHLVVCLIEVDMNTLFKNISLQTNERSTTFCNIYTDEGISLTNVVLAGMATENNLFQAMEHADFGSDYSVASMRKDFAMRHTGVISFTYNDVKGTMCYVPIPRTNWLLTYMVRESVISDQISSISEGIITRNFILSLLTAFVLAGSFAIMISQVRKASKINLEKSISETENRVKQQELEEQLALQEELLAQEQQRAQQDSMITALASDYRSVYYINLDDDTGIGYRSDEKTEAIAFEREHFNFTEKFTEYANNFIDEKYRDGFLEFIKPESIRAGLEKNVLISYRYLMKRDGKESYEMLRMAGVRHAEDRVDHMIHAVGVGFTDIDSEMRESMQQSQALSDALKAAEEASKAKTVFLSNMSHEIRTPMNAIIGLDNLALHEPNLSTKTKDYLTKIGSSAQHLLSLINDILDMSRIESGRVVIRSEEFDFSKLIEQINTIVGGQCLEKGLTYNCHVDDSIGEFFIGDSVKLRQVLINILGNAVKFTPKGGYVDFIVDKTASFNGRSTLTFTIKDTGIGMSKEYLPKIFETFSQENSETTNKYGSSGLGMAITKSIVEMMHGEITVDSEKGVGTTFNVVVTLPESERKASTDSDDIRINPREMSVLVVDDDPVACEHAKLVLEKAGIASEIALSGQEALEMVRVRYARREPYNLIIIDWHMPRMNGVEATRQIRSIIGDETAIIILTAYNWEDVMDEAKAAGVDTFISKPLFSGSLIEEFKNALRKKKLSAENRRADLAGLKILLAEDMTVNAEIMMEVLKMRDMQPEHAENGEVAVEMFKSSPEGYYSAILMDMRMPKMNGLEATAAIRALDRKDARTIPIIALTANAFDEDVQRSLQAGLNAHLTKPVNPEILFDTLEKML